MASSSGSKKRKAVQPEAPAAEPQCLLVIDMQHDFCVNGAPLCVPGAAACTPNVIAAVAAARRKKIRVVWVVVEHEPGGSDVVKTRQKLFANTPGGVLVAGTPGAALVTGLKRQAGDLFVVKKRWSAFFQTPLELMLRALNFAKVTLAGVQLPNCIRATAYDAIALGFDVEILADATASKNSSVHAANLEDCRCAGIATPTLAEWDL